MRCYMTATVARAERIWQEGFRDTHSEFGLQGIYFSTAPLDVNDGFDGAVTLCLDVPDDAFDQYDVTDEIQKASGYRLFLVPAAVLNKLRKPQVYDHEYAGNSRRELLQAIRTWEQSPDEGARELARGMRDAFDFFDKIGWLTPLKLQEEGSQQ